MYPEYQELKALCESGQYDLIPIKTELYADIKTAVEVLKVLKKADEHCFMLESVEDAQKWGRYTFLGFAPSMEITCRNGEVKIDGKTVKQGAGPDKILRGVLTQCRSPKLEHMPPFTGGFVGYFSYDYIQYNEPTLKLDAKDEEMFNDMDVMLFDQLIVFDNFRQKIILIVNMPCKNFDVEYLNALERLEELEKLIRCGEAYQFPKLCLKSQFKPLFSEKEYCSMVQRAKDYIYEGDIFQVVLSNRLEAEMEGSLFDAYRVLRTTNPSPYMFYFSGADMEITGASPETLVKLQDDRLYTFPLAGTRPRGKTEEEDATLEKELLADEKELSEHNMLVDLGRNDIGRISKIGSVQVERYLSIERFSHVMHIGSTVSGQILDDCDAIDAIHSILPAGTLSGAPKLRACEIINELENNKRGIYGGAVGYLDFAGNLDTCIAIRLAYAKNGKVFVRSGAEIVAHSQPEREYQECINKAKAVVNAIELAQRRDEM